MRRFLLAWLLAFASSAASAFDHQHTPWTRLLASHVVTSPDGRASRVRYAAFATDRPALQAYLATLSAVTPTEYQGWTRPQRLAFLINAYNAFTIELVLTRYPRLDSIRDLGSLFRSPWRIAFVPLLGDVRSLDDIEHGLIRAPGTFDDPRIHGAVNCASIGCPMLAPEAYVADRLDAQLDDAMARFLADRSRNRFDPGRGRLEVSRIFAWYRDDFERGARGLHRLQDLFARHADRLADREADRRRLREGQAPIEFLDYDWRLNDAG